MTIYHGTGQKTDQATYLYFTSDIEIARAFALGLDKSGNFNEESFIYSTEIDDNDFEIEEDFEVFDCLAYHAKLTRNIYNPQKDCYIVINPTLKLELHYINEL